MDGWAAMCSDFSELFLMILSTIQTAGWHEALGVQGERPTQRGAEISHKGGTGAAEIDHFIGEGKCFPGLGQGMFEPRDRKTEVSL